MEETGYEVICGVPMTLAVKGQVKVKQKSDSLLTGHQNIKHNSKNKCGPKVNKVPDVKKKKKSNTASSKPLISISISCSTPS